MARKPANYQELGKKASKKKKNRGKQGEDEKVMDDKRSDPD